MEAWHQAMKTCEPDCDPDTPSYPTTRVMHGVSPPVTLVTRLLALVALALLPAMAAQVWTGVELRRGREAALALQAVAGTRDVQADVVRIGEGVRQLLLALAEATAIRDGDLPGCTAYLKRVARQFRDYSLLAVNAPDGSILCSSAGAEPGSYSNAGRAYHQRAMASGAFAMATWLRGWRPASAASTSHCRSSVLTAA